MVWPLSLKFCTSLHAELVRAAIGAQFFKQGGKTMIQEPQKNAKNNKKLSVNIRLVNKFNKCKEVCGLSEGRKEKKVVVTIFVYFNNIVFSKMGYAINLK